MSFADLRRELDEGKTRPLYVFTGDEKEVMRQYIQRIGHPTLAKSLNDIWNQLTSKSLFAIHRRVYVIENDKSVFDIDIERIIRACLESGNSVVLKYDSIDGRVKWFKTVVQYIVEFPKFDEYALRGYIKKRIDVSDDIAVVLARYCNNEVSRVDNEIHKLRHLDCDIKLDVLNELITPPLDDRIFEMINCVALNKWQFAFEMYSDLIELGESPVKIVSLLYTKFKQVLTVQSLYDLPNHEVAAKSGMNFGQVGYARELCGQFTSERLVNIIQLVFKCECDIKGGSLDPKVAMDKLLLDILN